MGGPDGQEENSLFPSLLQGRWKVGYSVHSPGAVLTCPGKPRPEEAADRQMQVLVVAIQIKVTVPREYGWASACHPR